MSVSAAIEEIRKVYEGKGYPNRDLSLCCF